MFEKDVNLCHHGGDVHTSGGGVKRNLRLHSLGSDLFSYFPCNGVINFAHWELSVSLASHDNRSDLVS